MPTANPTHGLTSTQPSPLKAPGGGQQPCDAPAWDQPQHMPQLYYQRTTPAERKLHQQWLTQLENQHTPNNPQSNQHLLVHAQPVNNGGWLYSLITYDWPEPGLLDKMMEAILRCQHVEGGLRIQRARIFTSKEGKEGKARVINLFEMHSQHGDPLHPNAVQSTLETLRQLRCEERNLLQTLHYFPTRNFVPLLENPPILDNQANPDTTCIRVETTRMSNRFISIFLHHIARSTLWWNVQMAELEQRKSSAVLCLYVLDQYQQKIQETPQVRKALLAACESMNSMLLGFNLHYQRRSWYQRDALRGHTTLHSRPDVTDLLAEIKELGNLAALHQIKNGLGGLVVEGYLTQQHLASIKQAQRFAITHQNTLAALKTSPPTPQQIDLCKRYFSLRNRAKRNMEPVFNTLSHPQKAHWRFNAQHTLKALAPNQTNSRFCCNSQGQLRLQKNLWLDNPLQTMQLFLLQAHTHLPIHPPLLEQIDMLWEGWRDGLSQPERHRVGLEFSQVLDTSIAYATSAFVMRTMRDSGVFRHWIPHFEQIQGLIHRNPDHYYTVDEHSLVLIEALQGLRLLRHALSKGANTWLQDYHAVTNEAQLLRFWQKHTATLHAIHQDPSLRLNPITSHMFRVFDELAETPLESLMEMGFYERTRETCLTAFHHLDSLNKMLASLFAFEKSLSLSEQRVLTMAGLLHDLKKPAQNHPQLGAQALDEVLDAMALPFSNTEVDQLRWLIENHLMLRPLMQRAGQGSKQQTADFVSTPPNCRCAKLLVLLTYADRLAVNFEPNRYQNDIANLSSLLRWMDA